MALLSSFLKLGYITLGSDFLGDSRGAKGNADDGNHVPFFHVHSFPEKCPYLDAVGQIVGHSGFEGEGFSSYHRVGEGEFQEEGLEDLNRDHWGEAKPCGSRQAECTGLPLRDGVGGLHGQLTAP